MYTHNSQVFPQTAADILMYDRESDVNFILKSDTDFSQYPADRYVPIGVVVVPGSHNVYGDGSCGVMSLKHMDLNSPDNGSTSYPYIPWGGHGDDTSLPNLNQIPTGNTSDGIPTEQFSEAYLPSDRLNSIQCKHDTDVYYYSSSSVPAPSPYLTDGSRNPGYYQTTSPSSSSNCLADFDGIGNSQVLWGLATSQSDWKTASSITHDHHSGYYPAACTCWRYHTPGTNQGDWYLPACGELGYIMPTFNKINEAITNMISIYGSSVGVTLTTNKHYWSSTEDGDLSARYIMMRYGRVTHNSKYDGYYVRAWLRFNNTLGDH